MNYEAIETALELKAPFEVLYEKFTEQSTIGIQITTIEEIEGKFKPQWKIAADGVIAYWNSGVRRHGKMEFYCPGSLKSALIRNEIKEGDMVKIVYKGTSEWTPPNKDEPVNVKQFWVEKLELSEEGW